MKALLTAVALALAAVGVAAQDKLDKRQAAAKACEDEVGETVKRMRNSAQQVQFVGGKRVLDELSADETGIKGAGRYRARAGGSVDFTYSCTYNAANNTTSGVLFSDSTATAALDPAPRGGAAAAQAASAIDGAIGSTDACESAVAQALQERHPRVGRIVFGSDTRRLTPAPNARTAMEGDGAVQPAPGMNQVKFSYRCVYDPRSGRVDRVTTRE
jgi:hypothetical protein